MWLDTVCKCVSHCQFCVHIIYHGWCACIFMCVYHIMYIFIPILSMQQQERSVTLNHQPYHHHHRSIDVVDVDVDVAFVIVMVVVVFFVFDTTLPLLRRPRHHRYCSAHSASILTHYDSTVLISYVHMKYTYISVRFTYLCRRQHFIILMHRGRRRR